MRHFFIPTSHNNYRAYLLRTPFLFVLIVVIYLFNGIIGVVPVSKVSAEINVQQLLQLHNNERKKYNLPPLRIDPTLNNSAQQKALAMLKTDCWSHYCPPGTSPWEFLASSGYNYLYAGENLAEGFFDTEAMMVAWMNSPTHRENILRPDFEDVGFGLVQGNFQGIENNIVVAVHFGAAQPKGSVVDILNNNDTRVLPAPEIVSPRDGSTLGTSNVDIRGTALEASQVRIQRDGRDWVTTDANEGIFTYRVLGLPDDRYQISAIGELGTRKSNNSNVVTFDIDTRADEILPSQITVVSVSADRNITLQVSSFKLSQLEAKFGADTFNFNQIAETIWQTQIPESYLDMREFSLVSRDLAGNLWEGRLSTVKVVSDFNSLPQFTRVAGATDDTAPVFVVSKAAINMSFIIFLTILTALDFIVLSRTGMTKSAGKSHLHFVLFVIIAIIAIAGTIVGRIGTGVNT